VEVRRRWLYLCDTSVLARATRAEHVARVVTPLFDAGSAATCAVTDLEVLFSARSPADYERIRTHQAALTALPITPEVCDRALDVQGELAAKSQHRGVSIPDLLIAACAEVNGATVLHYDSDYDLIASVTGQPTAWVAPRGTIP
jgi:predicted nucleic acid-binding protein